MADRTKQLLIVIVGTIAILTAAFVIGVVTFGIVYGRILVPEVTRTNFWAFVDFIITAVIIPLVVLKMAQLQQSSRRNGQRIEEAAHAAHTANEKLENGIKTSLKRIEAATTQGVAGGKRKTDPPVADDVGTNDKIDR